MTLLDRLSRLVTRTPAPPGGEAKQYATPPATWPENWFQLGMTPGASSGGSVVEACVAAYAQTIAQLPPKHVRMLPTGEREPMPDSPVAQLLNRPNFYQTRSDFLLNLVAAVLYEGNGYFVGVGDRIGRPEQLFLLDPRATHARRVRDDAGGQEVFYSTGGAFADMLDAATGQVMIPAYSVGHVRLFTPHDPLLGVSPISNAAASVSANNSITAHQAAFFTNMTRPSGVLSTDADLTADQMVKLRDAWAKQSQRLNSGGVPILANGLKWHPLSITSHDAQLVDAWRMSIKDVARVFRVPPMLIGDMENSTFNNAETLMRFWLASGLGFMIDHVEDVLHRFFRLPADQRIELDFETLLRTDRQARVTALGEGVQKGVYTPNEARRMEGRAPVPGGDTVFLQAQMLPIDDPARSPAPASDAGVAEAQADAARRETVIALKRRSHAGETHG